MTDPDWIVDPYDPADEAPEGEPDHDCTGEGEGEQDSWPAAGARRPF